MTSVEDNERAQQLVIVLTNCPEADAAPLARALVEAKVASCVNLIPGVRSIYRWQGQICDEPEVTMLIKTTQGRHDDLVSALRLGHPYTVPEIVTLSPLDVLEAYAQWNIAQVTP